jgi:hypothetical protein
MTGFMPVELDARVRSSARKTDLPMKPDHRSIATISIHQQDDCEAMEMSLGTLGLANGRVDTSNYGVTSRFIRQITNC